MNPMTTFKSVTAARKAVIAAGFTKHEGVGQAGDYAYGSREYYSRPGCEVNQFGCPMEIATISKMPGGWCTFDL